MSDSKKLNVLSFIDYSLKDNIIEIVASSNFCDVYVGVVNLMGCDSNLDNSSNFKYVDLMNPANEINDKHLVLYSSIINTLLSKYCVYYYRIFSRYSEALRISKNITEIEDTVLRFLVQCLEIFRSNNINSVWFQHYPHLPLEYIALTIAKELSLPSFYIYNFPLDKLTGNSRSIILEANESLPSSLFTKRLGPIGNSYNTNKEIFENIAIGDQSKVVSLKRFVIELMTLVQCTGIIGLYSKISKYILRYVFRIVYNHKRLSYINYYKKKSNKELKLQGLKYFYFPLHHQPEASTMVKSDLYEDTLFAIKSIHSSLNQDEYLIIKEHPLYWKKRTLEDISHYRNHKFLDSITQLNKVIVADISQSSKSLIKFAIGTITVTGSVIVENYLKGKYTVVLGNTPMESFPNVIKYDYITLENLDDILNTVRIKNTENSDWFDTRTHFMNNLFDLTFEMNFFNPKGRSMEEKRSILNQLLIKSK
jgi:hypothetical protein